MVQLVGIGAGISTPTTALDVDGQITMRVGAAAGFIPIADASGTMTWTDPSSIITGGLWQSNSPNIYFNTGNVGIGTNNPEDKLQVGTNSTKLVVGSAGGKLLGWGTSYIGFNASRQNNATWSTVDDGNPGANNGGAVIYGDIFGGIYFSSIPTTGTGNQNGITDATVKDNTRLYIREDGNIGIGTEKVNDYKLSVEGFIRARRVNVEATSIVWSDYVFDSDYKLKSLTEVEKFIKENKHLPDVPSSKDVIENGIDLGEMDGILLQKIEELTLYVIDLKKDNEELRILINKK